MVIWTFWISILALVLATIALVWAIVAYNSGRHAKSRIIGVEKKMPRRSKRDPERRSRLHPNP